MIGKVQHICLQLNKNEATIFFYLKKINYKLYIKDREQFYITKYVGHCDTDFFKIDVRISTMI